MDRNCLSYWFPKLESAGLPVPRTKIVKTDVKLIWLLDGKIPDGCKEFMAELGAAVKEIGLPCFLRTGQGSGKHFWKNTCHLTNLDLLEPHVAELVEWSECVDMFGLPYDVWVVRELLPTKPLAVASRYGDFPMVKEMRCFVGDGTIFCQHPYWPAKAVYDGFARGTGLDDDEQEPTPEVKQIAADLQTFTPDEQSCITTLASRAAEVFKGDGEWSVDILKSVWEGRTRFYITDMAEAARSFHWETCHNAKANQ